MNYQKQYFLLATTYIAMIKLHLKKVEHDKKVGNVCEYIEPNVLEDCLLYEDGELIGFFIKNIGDYSKKLESYISIADNEFRSKRVPKSDMARSDAVRKRQLATEDGNAGVIQFSTIIGSVPPKPMMRRAYPTMSSVHNVPTAKNFIKAMLLACREAEKVIKEIAPNLYKDSRKLIEDHIPKKWRFGNLFTSSISNFNIAAGYHRDSANLVGAVNVIITKRKDCLGGCLNVPDYGATFDSQDNSMLVYPAWKNLHGVTPIKPIHKGGYRNSLIFYPLKAFEGLD